MEIPLSTGTSGILGETNYIIRIHLDQWEISEVIPLTHHLGDFSVVFFSQVRQAFCPTRLTTKVINSTQWTSSPSFRGENQHKTNNIPQKNT